MNLKKTRGTTEKESRRRFEEIKSETDRYFDDSIRNRSNSLAEHHGTVFVDFLNTVSIPQSKYLPVETIICTQYPRMRRYSHCFCDVFVFGATAPYWARASSFTRFLDHTQRRTAVGRTPLDGSSARRRNIYLTTLITHERHLCIRWDLNPRSQLESSRRPTL